VRVLLTGAAGFIGSHLTKKWKSDESVELVALDSFSDYYSAEYKRRRWDSLVAPTPIRFEKVDISDEEQINRVFADFAPDTVVHLAAQAGVRLSPHLFGHYTKSNLMGFSNVLNASVRYSAKNFLYASSSSVYGDHCALPLSEIEQALSPTSFYGATKLSNEIIAKSFSQRYGLRTRGLRFFTVYGPWGRPDMAYFRILSAIANDTTFELNGDGSIRRDFTFIDDVVNLVIRLKSDLETRESGFGDVVNLGGGAPRSINELIGAIETCVGRSLRKTSRESEPSDVKITHASSDYREKIIGKTSFASLESGVRNIVEWGGNPDVSKYLEQWVKSSEVWNLPPS
jgi:UDP-glucuronate 4-epimerase